MLFEQIRIFGKQGWGVDPANIKCPVFYYHPELDAEIPRACAEHSRRIIPGCQLIDSSSGWPGVGHSTIVYHADEPTTSIAPAGSNIWRPCLLLTYRRLVLGL